MSIIKLSPLAALFAKKDDYQGTEMSPLFSCYGCLLSCGIVAYWIWGIVVIANKEVMGSDGCPFAPDT